MGIKDAVGVLTLQITVQYASELLMAVGLVLGSILLARFTWNRVKNLPQEERFLGRPLWVATISIFCLGLASGMNFIFQSGFSELEIFLLITATLGSVLLLFSAIMIIGSKKFLAIPAVLVIGVAVFISIGNMIGSLPLGITSEDLSSIIGLILFSIPFVLFSYLTVTTKRITSFALAVVSITYPLLAFVTTFTSPAIIAVVLALRLWGPALLITALILSDTKIGAELMAYSVTIAALLYFVSYLTATTIPFQESVALRFVAAAGILGLGTAVYSFTRWRNSRSQATLAIAIYFLVGGLSFWFVALTHVDFLPGNDLTLGYIALILGITAPMLLNLSSIVALDWKRLLLLPVLIFAAPMVMIIIYWPQGVSNLAIPGIVPILAVAGILQSVIPMALYGTLWWRMRKIEAPGRSRALFLMVGVVLLIIGSASGNTVTILPSISILAAFVAWWLGVTGRADILLKTAG